MNAVLQPDDTVIREMSLADVNSIDTIERESYPYPWSAGIFKDCLRAGYCCQVAWHDGGVVGYAVMSVAAGEAHILNLCVAPQLRRSGIGRRLLRFLIHRAQTDGAEHLFLEVRPSNQGAVSLYDNSGFNQVGVRPNYYPAEKGREDALVLALDLRAIND